MQQLFQLIKQRIEKAHTITKTTKLTPDLYRQIREEQKSRCEKESWMLSMFRSKKSNLTNSMKNNYFKYSYQIMRIIDPTFNFQAEPNLSDENFLNDFVCMYTKFFDNYEHKFQFKVKVRNLLRPTNHNVLNDLIKYLADFSRDYSQHVYLWQVKEAKRQEELQGQQSMKKVSIYNNHNSQNLIYSSDVNQSQMQKQKSFNLSRNSMNIGRAGQVSYTVKKPNQQSESEIVQRKQDFNKMYGILDIQLPSNFVFIQKSKSNIELIRLRMNELYRETKNRNTMIKGALSYYYNSYNIKYNPSVLALNQKQNMIDDLHPHISYPYRVSLVIQKNGFSFIHVALGEQERGISPNKQRVKLSSLSTRDGFNHVASKTGAKNQFVLNSLKVLRVSENFLPPLILKRDNTRINSQQEVPTTDALVKNMTYSNTQNMLNLQVDSRKDMQYVNNKGVVYYNQQLSREAQRKKQQKRRITQLRKHFSSDQRGKGKSRKKNDPQQKIVEWLDKINIMKQLERKKILGLG